MTNYHILAVLGDKKNNVALSASEDDSIILHYKNVSPIRDQILFNLVKINIFINLDKYQKLSMVH